MKKLFSILIIISILLSGCFAPQTENAKTSVSETAISADTEPNLETNAPSANTATKINDILNATNKNFDYMNDYSAEIESEVESLVSASSSLQDEMNNIKMLADIYSEASAKANSQTEINFSSNWRYTVWDKELNNIWKRIYGSADKNAKKNLLNEQRNWIAMKEEATLLNIGSALDNGSIYPLLQNTFLADITQNRCYLLVKEFAKVKNETYNMPERLIYGMYVDNQKTNSIYSSLITRKNIENDNEAVISIYRLGQTEGNFIDNGNGKLAYTSYDESVKGIITLVGWDLATFEVLESTNSPFTVGEKFTFDFAF